DTVMLVMIGVWIAMQNAELLGWGGVAKSVPTPFPTHPVVWGHVSVSPLRLFVFAVSGLLILGAHLLLARTKLGRAMRATFQDRETAALMGVSIERIHTVTFALGAALAAAAGALLGPVFLLYPSMGDLASLKAFSVVILGGLGNFAGAALGGLVLGVAEELGAGYVSSGYRDAVGFLMIVAGSLLRPSGLVVIATAPLWVWNPYHLHTLIMAGIFAVLALSLNLLLGYTGQLSLGHAAFFGIGAYATALLTVKLEWSPWLGMVAAVVVPALAGWVIGRLALQSRRRSLPAAHVSLARGVS